MARRLEHTVGSYGKIFLIGMLIGGICRLADYFPGDTLWSLSSIQTLLGFWVITNTLIVLFSTSHLCAGESSFLYMFGMTLSFYGLQAVLGTFIPLLSGGFRFSLFVMLSLLSIPCGMAAFFLYDWNRDRELSSILYALPVGALAAEAAALAIYLSSHQKFLFQLLMDGVGMLAFGALFYRRTRNRKLLYLRPDCEHAGVLCAGLSQRTGCVGLLPGPRMNAENQDRCADKLCFSGSGCPGPWVP